MFEILNQNQSFEIERYVELYVKKYTIKSIKSVTAVAYFRYCELFKNDSLFLNQESSVLANKKILASKLNIKINLFHKIYK